MLFAHSFLTGNMFPALSSDKLNSSTILETPSLKSVSIDMKLNELL